MSFHPILGVRPTSECLIKMRPFKSSPGFIQRQPVTPCPTGTHQRAGWSWDGGLDGPRAGDDGSGIDGGSGIDDGGVGTSISGNQYSWEALQYCQEATGSYPFDSCECKGGCYACTNLGVTHYCDATTGGELLLGMCPAYSKGSCPTFKID